jgi:glycosyltransferase Alg8
MSTLVNPSKFTIRAADIFGLYLMLGVIALGVFYLPNKLWDPRLQTIVVSIGALGLWRYAWWMTHFIRAQIYGLRVYPRLRARADASWQGGWRPRCIHFMMTTFKEDVAITHAVLDSIVLQCREIGCPATLHIGTGHPDDEQVIKSYFAELNQAVDLDVTLVRQVYPGKRMAIGLVLRTMSRDGIGGDDPVIFMDGDTILESRCALLCISIFGVEAEIDALTTDERAVVHGPAWMQHWLDMRFAQRHMAMQSHALSRKVLTLTGRMSVFRARSVLDEEFISTVENDYLDHWLWGRFRFLSGDDKSTWYVLLRRGANMLYVPDAMCYTVERIEGSGIERMQANLLRWSGNMLRNGTRALALGPRRVGLFIWWCVLDQRIATWTTLVAPIAAVAASLLITPWAMAGYLLWVLSVRLIASAVLFGYARRVDAWFPILLYVNQLLNASLKLYIWYRLPRQRWSNRGDQRSAVGAGWVAQFREIMAGYLTQLSLVALIMVVLLHTQLIRWPTVWPKVPWPW